MRQHCPFCLRQSENPRGTLPVVTCASCRATLEQDPQVPGIAGYLPGGPVGAIQPADAPTNRLGKTARVATLADYRWGRS